MTAPIVWLPKFGVTSVCGLRRYMEDAVSIHPSFCLGENENRSAFDNYHYFGLYDGHGCSHVAERCKEFMHILVKEEILSENNNVGKKWEEDMKQSFKRMDGEATKTYSSMSLTGGAPCGCNLKKPFIGNAGSAVVVAIITPNKIVISNCGDCRAVLYHKGKAIPLSVDHKPDRPDELRRIHAAGGTVISLRGARVQGVLSMSRAIGDANLKPYVICDPEVTINDRTAHDEFLILASDGLWDVVTNETACAIVRMCLRMERAKKAEAVEVAGETYDRSCFKASSLLARLAVKRGSCDNISVVIINLKND